MKGFEKRGTANETSAGIHALLLAVAHLAVDMTTVGYLISRAVFVSTAEVGAFAVLLYNLLAFGLQPLFGILIDATHRVRPILALSLIVVGVFGLFDLGVFVNLVFLAAANAAFHASAASVVIADCPNRASFLGVFVSLGAVGLSLGYLPSEIPRLAGAILCLFALIFVLKLRGSAYRAYFRSEAEHKNPPKIFALFLAFAFAAVFFRGFAGSLVRPDWNLTAETAILVASSVAIGKAIGGFLADALGAATTAVLTLVPAAFLLSFGQGNPILCCIGLILFNTSMPVTLYLAIKLLPRFQSFAFGATAAMLMFGSSAAAYALGEGAMTIVLTLGILLQAFLITAAAIGAKKSCNLPMTEEILSKARKKR